MRLKNNIDLFIFPSFSTQNIFSSFFKISNKLSKVIYHGIEPSKFSYEDQPVIRDHLRIGILGSMLKHKGESLIRYIIQNTKDNNISFYHFGDGNLKDQRLITYGKYDRLELPKLLNEYNLDVMLLLSTWPETFSYTLSESINAGNPPNCY